mgnify:CR=1 FL=1
MSTALTFLILIAPFAVAVELGWAARRSGILRFGTHQFTWSAPMTGRLSGSGIGDDPRVAHEVEAIRTRFERHPTWPSSGALGERR